MVFINEWFPNPNGTDSKGEFIELFNSGNAPVNLSGWVLKTTAKKSFSFGAQTIAAHGYLVLTHATTRLSLKNTGETVSLYDSSGRLVDQSTYLGAAPSGQSYSRVYYPSIAAGDIGTGAEGAAIPQSFTWGTPTPGAANKVDLHNAVSSNPYPFGRVLNARDTLGGASGLGMFVALLLGASAILAALVVYSLKSDENLSQLFFGGDEAVRF